MKELKFYFIRLWENLVSVFSLLAESATEIALIILLFCVMLVIGYQLTDSILGQDVTIQVMVVEKDFYITQSGDTITTHYIADLIEDGKFHEDVSFSHRNWKNLSENRSYRMTCKEGYFTNKIITCWP